MQSGSYGFSGQGLPAAVTLFLPPPHTHTTGTRRSCRCSHTMQIAHRSRSFPLLVPRPRIQRAARHQPPRLPRPVDGQQRARRGAEVVSYFAAVGAGSWTRWLGWHPYICVSTGRGQSGRRLLPAWTAKRIKGEIEYAKTTPPDQSCGRSGLRPPETLQ